MDAIDHDTSHSIENQRICLNTLQDDLGLNLIYELLSMKNCCGIHFERYLLELLHCTKNYCKIRYEYKLDDMTSGHEYELLQRMTNYCGCQLCWSCMLWNQVFWREPLQGYKVTFDAKFWRSFPQ